MRKAFAEHGHNLLTLGALDRAIVEALLHRSAVFAQALEAGDAFPPCLAGRIVVNMFFEDSTRTRVSFEIAARRLGAEVVNFTAAGSSTAKGESLLDTVRTIDAMGPDVMVIRHAGAGAAALAARAARCAVLNAGDGRHAHPTQGLLDLLTLRQRLGELAGRHVLIVGDIANSRVARSDLEGLLILGARVTLVGPATLLPRSFEQHGARVAYELDPLLPSADAVMLLRVQNERLGTASIPSQREFAAMFGMNAARLRLCRPDVVIMHPGPMNRGVEISAEVADGENSVILGQVSNGLAVRMAVLEWCCASAKFEERRTK